MVRKGTIFCTTEMGTLNFSRCIDTNPKSAPETCYKAAAGVLVGPGRYLFPSPDGIDWSLLHKIRC